MSKGIESFRKERLIQAREARGLSGIGLADLSGINDVSISKYERGHALPPRDRLESLSTTLRVPMSYFLRPMPAADPKPVFWRSLHVSAKVARKRAQARYGWIKDISDYLESFFEFPAVRVPDVHPPSDFLKIDGDFIECVARDYRKEWNVERGPFPDALRLLEKNGIIIARSALEAENLDAFSQIRITGRPHIFLGSDKGTAVRSRFDALHELGHLLLHSNVDEKTFNVPQNWKHLEAQAHRFAGAMLLPSDEFLNDLVTPTLDGFRAIKSKWKTAIGAMIQRCKALGVITEEQTGRLHANMVRKEWNRKEPLDDILVPETPRLLNQGIKMLVDEGVRSKSELPESIGLYGDDITDLSSLPRGYFDDGFGEVIPLPKFKDNKLVHEENREAPKIISFPNASERLA